MAGHHSPVATWVAEKKGDLEIAVRLLARSSLPSLTVAVLDAYGSDEFASVGLALPAFAASALAMSLAMTLHGRAFH